MPSGAALPGRRDRLTKIHRAPRRRVGGCVRPRERRLTLQLSCGAWAGVAMPTGRDARPLETQLLLPGRPVSFSETLDGGSPGRNARVARDRRGRRARGACGPAGRRPAHPLERIARGAAGSLRRTGRPVAWRVARGAGRPARVPGRKCSRRAEVECGIGVPTGASTLDATRSHPMIMDSPPPSNAPAHLRAPYKRNDASRGLRCPEDCGADDCPSGAATR
jgi:hypothetical protein